jgi:predicted transcriptional regulator
MTDSFDDLEFLARAETRVRAIQLLAENSYNRDELIDRLGISRATLSRLLRQFEDRDWVKKNNDGYTTTRFGSALAQDITRLLETTEII